MNFRRTASLFVLGVVASCSAGENDPSLVQDEAGALGDGDLASSSQSLTKGSIGAVNGDKDYCADPSVQCVAGEGDCDSSAECVSGTRCLPDNGSKFGFPAAWDVCAPAHCGNGILDAAQGETSPDCGGPCGNCVSNCTGTPGGKDFCAACLCASGQGDCDSTAECQPGLICATDNGPNFGLAVGYDVCVPSTCVNGVQDAGETGVDSGGPCGSHSGACTGTPGSKNFCVGCTCTSGQGDCDGNQECAAGLVCGSDNGAKFGLPNDYDVCVPPHCTNGMLDSSQGETAVDLGGPCGPVGAPSALPSLFFSEYVEGSGGNRALEIYNAGGLAQGCIVAYYLGASFTPAFAFALPDIAPHGILTVCHSTAAIASPPCDMFTTLGFNGDDSIELSCGNGLQDVFGQVGFDPGIEWGSGFESTADNTLRRKCSINAGDVNRSDTFLPSLEWDGFSLNDFSGLGTRGCP